MQRAPVTNGSCCDVDDVGDGAARGRVLDSGSGRSGRPLHARLHTARTWVQSIYVVRSERSVAALITHLVGGVRADVLAVTHSAAVAASVYLAFAESAAIHDRSAVNIIWYLEAVEQDDDRGSVLDSACAAHCWVAWRS